MEVHSGNDACIALAEAVGGSEAVFVQAMNREAARLGMKNTNFMNATGLPDAQHYSTARDLYLLAAALIRDFPEEYARYEHDPYSFAPAGGETGLAVTARALPALLDIVDRHCDREVLVVSHKATIRLILSSLLGFDPRKYRDRLDQSPAALNILDFKDAAHARLTLFNDTSHYDRPVPEIPKKRLSKVWDQT